MRSIFVCCLLFLLMSVAVIAQKPVQYTMTKDELMVKQKELLNEIAETQRQLDAIKNDKKATMGQLRALQNKLAQRQNLIATINEQMNDIDNDIKSSSKEVGTLKEQLDVLKIRYAESIRYAYETRSSYDMLAFLFSSQDFNDAMRRMKYLKTFREFRKEQVEKIRTTQAQLQHKIGTLNAEKAQKEELVTSQEQQKKVLIDETKQTNDVIESLKGKESELLKKVEKNRKVAASVNNAINYYIEKEMAAAAKKAEEEEKKKEVADAKLHPEPKPVKAGTGNGVETNEPKANPKTKPAKHTVETVLLTPTEVTLANNFEENKGKLYWPVDQGYITGHFGKHPYPLAPGVEIDNPGIDIQTKENASVHAVFDGTVSKVFIVTGSQWVVMIVHGNYFTVYNGLASVSVKEGQHVSTKDIIGKVGMNDEDLPTINFQIWKYVKKDNIKLNPEIWISKAH